MSEAVPFCLACVVIQITYVILSWFEKKRRDAEKGLKICLQNSRVH